jgi:hypothetical protein
MLATAEARAYTAAQGLRTRQQLIDYCRAHRADIGKGKMHGEFLRRFQANKPVRLQIRERVPGEDEVEAVV